MKTLLQGKKYVPASQQTVEHLRQVFSRERRRLEELKSAPKATVREIKGAKK